MTTLASILAAALLAACAAGPEQPETCEPPGAPAAVVEDALVLGLAGAGAGGFEPLADGAPVELVLGSQGGWMITPVLAVDRAKMAGDGACAQVAVEVDLGAAEPVRFELTVPELAGSDDHFYSDPLPVFLSYDLAELEQRQVLITAAFVDDEVASSCQVAVHLENRD